MKEKQVELEVRAHFQRPTEVASEIFNPGSE